MNACGSERACTYVSIFCTIVCAFDLCVSKRVLIGNSFWESMRTLMAFFEKPPQKSSMIRCFGQVGCMWVFPRSVGRFCMDSRKSLFNASGYEVSKLCGHASMWACVFIFVCAGIPPTRLHASREIFGV